MAKRKNTFNRIPDTELLVMQGIWDAYNNGIDAVHAQDLLDQQPDTLGVLKLTTVQTLLTRLVERGYVSVEKQKRSNLYRAAIDEEEYRRLATRDFVQNVCRQSGNSLLTALVADGLVEDDAILGELRALLEKDKEKN